MRPRHEGFSASRLSIVLMLLAVALATAIGVLATFDRTRYLPAFLLTASIVLGASIACLRRARARPARSVLVAAVLGAGFLLGWSCFFRLGPEREELPSEGDAFVVALTGYRERNGRFPRSLVEAGCEPRWNRFGGWRYQPAEDGASFHLFVGEYHLDGFVIHRDSRDASWYEDG